jgi:hypothetical protein
MSKQNKMDLLGSLDKSLSIIAVGSFISAICMLGALYFQNIQVNAVSLQTGSTIETTASAQIPSPTPSPTATSTPTATPTPSPSPTPSPTPVPETPEEWYELALDNGEVQPASDDCLNSYNGVFQGPSGRETFYNLNMDLVVAYMRDLGYSEEDYPYWVREDGCKMLGNYIIVAANFSTRPKGTILETSLGTAIVCDTGSFVNTYPNGIDIAVDW